MPQGRLQFMGSYWSMKNVTLVAINRLWPINGTWRHSTGLTLIQIMVLLPDGHKPLPKLIIIWDYWHPPNAISQTMRETYLQNIIWMYFQRCLRNCHWTKKIIETYHDDVIKWKHFPRHWPFVRGIHRSPVNSPQKGQWRGALIFFFDLRLNKRLSKHETDT